MFVMGGSNGLLKPIGNGTVQNDVWVSDDLGKSWSMATAAAPWPAREGLQKLTALYGSEDMIVLTSGEAGYSGPYFNDVWGTTDGANWSQLSQGATFSARSGNLMINLDGALYTFGGYGVPMKHDGYCLPAGASGFSDWVKLGEAPWHGRFDYDMVVANGSIVLLAGEASLFGAGGPYFNDIWAYELPKCE
jgi:N-acetylneuraminic acid mutarotase